MAIEIGIKCVRQCDLSNIGAKLLNLSKKYIIDTLLTITFRLI